MNASSMGMKNVHPRQVFKVLLSDKDEMSAAAFGVPAGAGSAKGVLSVFMSVSGCFSV